MVACIESLKRVNSAALTPPAGATPLPLACCGAAGRYELAFGGGGPFALGGMALGAAAALPLARGCDPLPLACCCC